MNSSRAFALGMAVLFFGLAVAVLLSGPRRAERLHQVVTQSAERSAERIEQRQRQRRQEADEARRLKPGERCLSGKYIREIPGGFEDDPAQDWKCRPPRNS